MEDRLWTDVSGSEDPPRLHVLHDVLDHDIHGLLQGNTKKVYDHIARVWQKPSDQERQRLRDVGDDGWFHTPLLLQHRPMQRRPCRATVNAPLLSAGRGVVGQQMAWGNILVTPAMLGFNMDLAMWSARIAIPVVIECVIYN